MKHALIAASLVLVAGATAGCGGGDGGSAPDNASTEEFCDSYTSMLESMMKMSPDSDQAVTALKDWGEKLEETGTPEDIPDEAREGFEVIVGALAELDADATQADLENLGGDLSAEEEQASEAFGDYVNETCPMEMPDLGDQDSEPGETTESP